MKTIHAVLISIPGTTCANTPECVAQQRRYSALALGRSAAYSGSPPTGYRKNDDEVPLPNEGYHWSVSHKRGLAGAVISEQSVGIDVEFVVPRREEFLDETASRAEWSIVGHRDMDAFFQVWTAKESVLKANGKGIGRFADCVVESATQDEWCLRFEGRLWRVVHYWMSPFLAAVAAVEGQVQWHVIPSDGRGDVKSETPDVPGAAD